MGKIKNKIIFLSILFTCFLGINKVDAASVSVSSNSSYITVGNTFTVSITVSSDVEAWDFSIGYDTSKLRVVNSGLENSMRSVNTAYNHSRSYSITFKATASGNASVYVSDAALASGSSYLSATKGSKTFTLRTQEEIEASYSKNNYLSSLSVDGVELSPSFDKDTSEYTVELEPETTKINVNAGVADSTASVSGAGEKEVTDGDNRIEIVVTAQNGTTRTYVINATVKEYDPITVDVDGKDYTVIRKKSSLTAPNNYSETTVTIRDEEVPAFKSDVTGYTLVGLKDSEGNTNLYVYEDGKYTLYKEYEFNKVILYPLEAVNIPSNYKKTTITYNDEEIVAYKLKESSKYALIYGKNIETGKTNWYMYDSKEDTLQIYNTEEVKKLNNQNKLYLKIVIGLGVLSFTLIVLTIMLAIKVKKSKKNQK
jgi:hypothetical protein